MKRSATALLLLLFLLFSVPVVRIVHGEEEAGEAASLNLQAYAPARILMSYAYTNNFSVSDVSSMGKSLYKVVSGPSSIEFKATDVDRYTFTIAIKYTITVAQSIQIAVFSGNLAPEGIQFNVKGREVRLEVTLTVTEEPNYPSAQSVAAAVVQQVANELVEFERQTSKVVQLQNRNLEAQWVLVIFNVAMNAALTLFMFLWMRPRVGERGV